AGVKKRAPHLIYVHDWSALTSQDQETINQARGAERARLSAQRRANPARRDPRQIRRDAQRAGRRHQAQARDEAGCLGMWVGILTWIASLFALIALDTHGVVGISPGLALVFSVVIGIFSGSSVARALRPRTKREQRDVVRRRASRSSGRQLSGAKLVR